MLFSHLKEREAPNFRSNSRSRPFALPHFPLPFPSCTFLSNSIFIPSFPSPHLVLDKGTKGVGGSEWFHSWPCETSIDPSPSSSSLPSPSSLVRLRKRQEIDNKRKGENGLPRDGSKNDQYKSPAMRIHYARREFSLGSGSLSVFSFIQEIETT